MLGKPAVLSELGEKNLRLEKHQVNGYWFKKKKVDYILLEKERFSPHCFLVFEVTYENHLAQSRLDPGTVVLSSLQIH